MIRIGWERGSLGHLLHEDQLSVYRQLREAFTGDARRFILEIARRWGKSFLLVMFCCEEAIRHPGSRIVYGSFTLKALVEFVHPAFLAVTQDAPEDLRPIWEESKKHYTFPNGSWIHLFGCDDERQAGTGRGGEAIGVVFDEAAFCSVLPFVMTSVFAPSLQLSNGWQLLSSTPADRPDHDFTAIAELEEAAGNYANRSWLDNPRLSDDRRAQIVSEMSRQAGMTPEDYIRSPVYLREYMGKRVVDPLLVAVPEWATVGEECTVAIERPKLFRGHVGLDFGGSADPHFAVFGYWHITEGLVIEDEILLRADEVHVQLIDAVKAKEKQLWGVDVFDGTLAALSDAAMAARFGDRVPDWLRARDHTKARGQPWVRVSDHLMELVRMLFEGGLGCLPAQKQEKQLRIQRLRSLVLEKKLKIHPRCVHLLRHLRQTTWKNMERREWARKGGEHGDGVDALSYLQMDLNRDIPLDPASRPPSAPSELGQALLGTSPLARRLLGRR